MHPQPNTPVASVLPEVQTLLERGDRPGALAHFRAVIDGRDLGGLGWRRQAHLMSAALWLRDAGFITSLLNAMHSGGPPIDVVIDEPVPAHGGAQGVLCQASASGWRFVIPLSSETDLAARSAVLQLSARFLHTLPLFLVAMREGMTQDGEVLLNLADAARFDGVGYCANSDVAGLIPDPDFMVNRGYADFLQFLEKQPVPWEAREKVAFWRGATTGRGLPDQPAWETLHRVHLCQAVQGEHAALFDVGFSRIQLPAGSPAHEAFPARGYMKPFAQRQDLQKKRYQIDIDGYVSAWSALFTKLATGCPVLKVGSRDGWRQWYYDRLVAWENYVPVLADLSDLAEKTRWLIDHDDDARRIGAAGRATALSLTYDSQVRAGASTIAGRIRGRQRRLLRA